MAMPTTVMFLPDRRQHKGRKEQGSSHARVHVTTAAARVVAGCTGCPAHKDSSPRDPAVHGADEHHSSLRCSYFRLNERCSNDDAFLTNVAQLPRACMRGSLCGHCVGLRWATQERTPAACAT